MKVTRTNSPALHHLTLARLNERLALRMAREAERIFTRPTAASKQAGRYLMGWAVIVLFYAALHYVDALLEDGYGWQTNSHEAQDAALARLPAGKQWVATKYHALRAASEEARYRGRCFSRAEWHYLYRCYFLPVKHEMRRGYAAVRATNGRSVAVAAWGASRCQLRSGAYRGE